jgi:hypothetical protein
MCEYATPEEREVRSARKRPAVELPKATEDDKDEAGATEDDNDEAGARDSGPRPAFNGNPG